MQDYFYNLTQENLLTAGISDGIKMESEVGSIGGILASCRMARYITRSVFDIAASREKKMSLTF